MEDLGENTTVLSTLRSLNSFISQRVEGGSGLDMSTSAPGSLQLQYEKNMQVSGLLRGALSVHLAWWGQLKLWVVGGSA